MRLTDLNSRQPTAVELQPDAEEKQAVAEALGIKAVKKLRFIGQLAPFGKRDWELTAELGATVVQDCVVTLAPVTTRIDEHVMRRYVADLPEIEGGEAEMPEDDTIEAIPETLDLVTVMIEALSLALPAYPRADGAELAKADFTEPGKTAMTDDDAKPFAGLGELRNSLKNKGE